MPHYPYLIVGGGMTAAAAAGGIREVDQGAVIGLIGMEPDPPYDRPPLTKGLWKGEPLDGIWRHIERQGVTAHLGREARELDPARRRVVDDQGTVYTYEKLLLATGGTPRRLPFGGDGVLYYRTAADYRRLRALTERGQRFAVIGGGFIGWEVAAALAMNGKHVTHVFPEATIGARVYPQDLGAFLTDYYREKGVQVVAQSSVTGVEPRGERWAVTVRPAEQSPPQGQDKRAGPRARDRGGRRRGRAGHPAQRGPGGGSRAGRGRRHRGGRAPPHQPGRHLRRRGRGPLP